MTDAPNSEIINRLKDVLVDLSGYDVDELDESATFLELGFDSLFLTQLATAFQRTFSVPITFRQLFDDLPTLNALSAHIARENPDAARPAAGSDPATPVGDDTPVQPVVPQPAAIPATPAATSGPPVSTPIGSAPPRPSTSGRDSVMRLMQQQLALMSEQLVALSGGSAHRGHPTPIATAAVAPVERASALASGSAVPSESANNSPRSEGDLDTPRAVSAVPFGPQLRKTEPELTPRQRRHLEDFVDRYNRRTAGSKAHTQAHRERHADPRTAAGFKQLYKEIVYPLVVERSLGSRLWDIDGNEYIDILNGFGPCMLGHNPPFIREAIARQLERGFEVGPQTPLAGETAELICEFTGMDRATFVNTGSEAVQAAMRVARTVTGRDKIVMFAKDYHGNFDEVLVRPAGRKGKWKTLPLAPGIPRSAVENVIVLDYGTDESLAWIREHANDLAAVIVEPMQSRRPEFVPREFIKAVREVTERSGTVFVFDEVITGFRSHPGGAQAIYGIRADLATYGKVIGGGMPIGVVAGRKRFMDTFDGGMWQYGDASYPEAGVTFFAGTFVRHPLAIAAAHASLLHFKERGPGLQQELNDRTSRLTGRLNALFKENELAISVPHFASQMFIRVEEPDDLAMLMFYHLRFRGIHVLEGFPSYMTTAHTDEDVDTIVTAFRDSIHAMQEGGIFRSVAASGITDADEPALTQLPLTEAQADIFVASSLGDAASCAYNESDTVELVGSLDIEKLREAAQRVLLRHEALHVTFDPSGAFQARHAPQRIDVPLKDLSSVSSDDRATALRQVLDEQASTPYSLESGPLVRAFVVRLDPQRHWFVLGAHHIVIDGWSSGVLLEEISHVYSALVDGQPYELPPATPFSRFVDDEERRATGPEGEQSLAYWKEQYATLPPVSALPTDRARPEVKSFAGGTVKWTLDGGVYETIRRAAAKQNVSLFAFLLAVYEVLLARLSNEWDLTVGVSIAGQASFDGDALVGHCVHLAPVRARLDPALPFTEHAMRVKRAILDAQDHQSVSLGAILRRLELPRSAARMPLVETMFNFSTDRSELTFSGLTAYRRENPRRHVNVELFANVLETAGSLTADWDYNAEVFDEATVKRWIQAYEILLAAAAADGSMPLGALPWMEGDELSEALSLRGEEREVAGTPLELMHRHLVGAHADARVAVMSAGDDIGDDLTYARLEETSNRFASHLRTVGVGRDTLVGVCLNRSTRLLSVLLGIWKAGAAYVPLDPNYPAERLRHIAEDARLSTLVCEADTAKTLESVVPTRVNVDDHSWESSSSAASQEHPRPTDTAYVLYTSGSTGRPKGVVVPHRAVANLLSSMARQPGMGTEDTLLAVTTLSFDISVLELFLPLVAGGRLALADAETATDGQDLADAIEDVGATMMQATPATWRMLLDDGWSGRAQLRALCGGEALPREIADRLVPRVSELWNMYGPTETTVWSTCHRVRAVGEPIVIGRPIDNTRAAVLDTLGQPQLTGVAGELVIAGHGVAEGYLRRPELTAERFISAAAFGGERAYRTGDLVRRRDDGALEHLGRMDDQVKLRGFRIELGDVEAALASHPDVTAAAAVVRTRGAHEASLLAFIVPRAEPPTASDLRKHVRSQVPEYMVPSQIEVIDRLPLSPAGKVDRRALPDLDPVSTGVAYEPLATDSERLLGELWRNILGTPRIGALDNFFDLGGHSLTSIQCIAKVRSMTGVRLQPRILLLETLRDVAAELDRLTDASTTLPAAENTGSGARSPNELGASPYAPVKDEGALGWLRRRLKGS